MSSFNFEGKTFVVFGGSGAIGFPITKALYEAGAKVVIACRNPTSDVVTLYGIANQKVYYRKCDVTKYDEVLQITSLLPETFSGMVYAVGNCPPGGLRREVERPLSDFRGTMLTAEFQRHVSGLGNCVQVLREFLAPESHILVIGSGITTAPVNMLPPALNAGHYAAAKAAQAEYLKWLRLDPFIRAKQIKVHNIAPGAVNTPFHQGAPPELQSPHLLPVGKVVSAVLTALSGSESCDNFFDE